MFGVKTDQSRGKKKDPTLLHVVDVVLVVPASDIPTFSIDCMVDVASFGSVLC